MCPGSAERESVRRGAGFCCGPSEDRNTLGVNQEGNVSSITTPMVCVRKRVLVKSVEVIFWLKSEERQGKVGTVVLAIKI